MEAAAEPLLPPLIPTQNHLTTPPSPPQNPSTMSFKSSWFVLAVASGTCAAFNGVFAKLTTTELTSSWSRAISKSIGLSASNKFIEFLSRATCFLLNVAFNGAMWALFTAALTRASSTTRVSVINTSANFMFTALLGLVIFRENLAPLWWLGAAALVVGTVVIGRRSEEEDKGKVGMVKTGGRRGTPVEPLGGEERERYSDREGQDGTISDGVADMGGCEVRIKVADEGEVLRGYVEGEEGEEEEHQGSQALPDEK